MRTVSLALAGALSLLFLLPAPAAGDALAALCRQFSGLDINADGRVELERLAPLDLLGPPRPATSDHPLILVIVEARLLRPLDPPASAREGDLMPFLRRYCSDLAREGFSPALISAQVYDGTVHQDGWTLLALRRFLQAVYREHPDLAGAVLVGSFPEAMLVRTCNWRRNDAAVLHRGTEREQRFSAPAPQLRSMAELVAVRCELVLADLDGDWEPRYHEARQGLPWLLAMFPEGVPPQGGATAHFEIGSTTFEDFFHVHDGQYTSRLVASPTGEWLEVRMLDDLRDAECAPADRELPNPLSRPEIAVSRINARGVALAPRADIRGVSGEGLLDADGRPQTVRFARRQDVPRDAYAFDAGLERNLLREYFERNHRYRNGGYAGQHRPAAVSYDLRNGMRQAMGASPQWRDPFDDNLTIGQANLADYAEWLTYPAALRDIRAHSYEWGSDFGRCSAEELEATTGPAWFWMRQGTELVPSLATFARRGRANFHLYRTLWSNGRVPEGAFLCLHTGCDGISPGGAERHPYNHPAYSRMQGAESLLFYAGGLALIGRAKTFYDAPRGFYEALARGESVGEAWREYFRIESGYENWGRVGGDIGRKRAYFWSVIGDWTLRLEAPQEASQ